MVLSGNHTMTVARWPNTGEWERIKDFPRDSMKADDLGAKMGWSKIYSDVFLDILKLEGMQVGNKFHKK